MSKDSKPSGTTPCACRFSSATGEQVVWCVVHDELREVVAGLIGEHAMLRERLEEVRGLIAADSPNIEQALFRINQALLATRPRVE